MIVKIQGGLGNQMFQYAFGYSMSQRNNVPLRLDITSFHLYPLRDFELNCFSSHIKLASRSEIDSCKFQKESIPEMLARKLLNKERKNSVHYCKEPYFHFDNDIVASKDKFYFDGYWQSEKYFSNYRADLLEHFSLKVPVHAKSKEYQQKILANQAVSLHIRRGDYVTNAKANAVHGTCGLDYYREAVSAIKKAVDTPCFFIFSDDMEWAKENIDFIDQAIFVELGSGSLDHEEMWLMSECQHNIIANSSFSWWGAWLNKNPNKIVIAPQRWFKDSCIITKDLIPESWLRL